MNTPPYIPMSIDKWSRTNSLLEWKDSLYNSLRPFPFLLPSLTREQQLLDQHPIYNSYPTIQPQARSVYGTTAIFTARNSTGKQQIVKCHLGMIRIIDTLCIQHQYSFSFDCHTLFDVSDHIRSFRSLHN